MDFRFYGVSALRTVCLITVEMPGAKDLGMPGNKGKCMVFPLQLPKHEMCCSRLWLLDSQQLAGFRVLMHPQAAFILHIHLPSWEAPSMEEVLTVNPGGIKQLALSGVKEVCGPSLPSSWPIP